MKTFLSNLISQYFEYFEYFETYDIFPWSDLSSDEVSVKKDVLIIICRDHFMHPSLFNNNNYNYAVSDTVRHVHNIAKTNSTKKVLFVTENIDSHREFSQLSTLNNLYIISTHNFLAVEYNDYLHLTPHTKKIKSSTTFLCLTGKPRPHRVQTTYYLIYKNLFNLGIITFLSGGYSQLDFDPNVVNTWAMPTHLKLNRFNKKLYKLNDYKKFGIRSEDYTTGPLNNSSNFNQLRDYYEKSYIEIITNPTCIEPSHSLDEKYINSVFGYVFPIFIATNGFVQSIRDLGFDVFDDIVDHSYDNEPNPYYRIKYAIDLNNKLLRDREFLEEKFAECIPRFEANVKHYKENLKRILESRVQQQLDAITF